MATTTTGVTQATCHIPELWDTETIDAVEAKVVLAGLVDRRFEKKLKVGDNLNIGYICNLAASAKTENTNVTMSAITEGSEIITVGTHEHVCFGIEDIIKVQSQTNLRQKYTEKIGYALGSSMDEVLSALATSFSQSVGTLGIELTDDNLIRAWQYLEDFNMPQTDRFIYLKPAAYAGLMKLDKFMHADYVGGGGKGVREAYVGRVYGANVYTSTLCNAPASGQCAGWFCHKSGVALIQQQIKTRSDYVIERDSDVVLGTNLFGYTEILIPPRTEGGSTALDYANVYLKTIA